MKAHLTDTHLLVPRSRSSAKVKVKYQGHVSQKIGVSGALVFHKHILFQLLFLGDFLSRHAPNYFWLDPHFLNHMTFLRIEKGSFPTHDS